MCANIYIRMSDFHHYDDNFASHFNSEEFGLLSPEQQEQHLHREGNSERTRSVSMNGENDITNGGIIPEGSYDEGHNDSSREVGTSAANASPNLDNKKGSKPKRTRATGEALDFLKKEFEANPNPTSQRRKKISELTGLPEKNVRIWFQNRRAKLRKSGQAKGGMGELADTATGMMTYDASEECPAYFDKIPLNINNNYYFIDICSITVGSWNRMKSGALRRENLPTIRDLSNLSPISINQIMSNATDMMVLISKKNFEINYFFSAMANNTKILFRIFFAINSVVNCSLTLEASDIMDSGSRKENDDEHESNDDLGNRGGNGDDGSSDNGAGSIGELKVTVSRPPNFAVYFLDSTDEGINNQWSICEDFSEGRQVNDAFIGGSNMPHSLKGSQSSLKFMNSLIVDYNSTNQILPPPPMNSQNQGIVEPQPVTLQPPSQTFFDQYDAANDILSLNRDTSGINVGANRDTTHMNDDKVDSDTHNDNGTHTANLLSLPQDSQIPNIPDFFKNPSELHDEHRWL